MREAMAASKRFLLIRSPFFRIHNKPLFPSSPQLSPSISKTHFRNLSLLNHSPLSFTKITSLTSSSSRSNFYHKYTAYSTSASAVADDTDIETTTSASTTTIPTSHPWPEWITFIEKLRSKGYLDESLSPVQDDDDDGDSTSGLIGTRNKDFNLLRNASFAFARERFDIFKSLSREHIQSVVECGCPSLFRKVVNSAKRLRAELGLDEGDVCSACNLRGSCDRAYGILKDTEASARTVDIVRILLIYALDPLVLSRGEKTPAREHIEVSARKLLSELIELSETAPDPSLPKPAVKPPKPKEVSTVGHVASQNVEMKRGDWICSNCNFLNFSRNIRCLECKGEGPKRVIDDTEARAGDWTCLKCNFMNFARNIRCLACKEESPSGTRVGADVIEMKKGDWTCPQCDFMNFARNTNCKRCQELRPKQLLQPGEWECPKCAFLNYRRNTSCFKCSCDKPKDEVAEYEEQIWKRPR